MLLMLRYFEDDGEVSQAVSVFKKRGSMHERTIRRFTMSDQGIEVGEVLRGYRGILTGVPMPPGTPNAADPMKVRSTVPSGRPSPPYFLVTS